MKEIRDVYKAFEKAQFDAKSTQKLIQFENFIIYKFSNYMMKKKSFFGAAKGVGPFTKEDKKWMEGRKLKLKKKN